MVEPTQLLITLTLLNGITALIWTTTLLQVVLIISYKAWKKIPPISTDGLEATKPTLKFGANLPWTESFIGGSLMKPKGVSCLMRSPLHLVHLSG